MKRNRAKIFLFIGISAVLGVSASVSTPSVQLAPGGAWAEAPLSFIPNRGQTSSEVLFYAQKPGATLWLTDQGMVFDRLIPAGGRSWGHSVSRLIFLDARKDAQASALDTAGHRVSYFYGSDEAEWRTDIPTSRAVIYRNLYDGIDLKIYGNEREIEFDWVARPGADPSRIRFAIEGDRQASLDSAGNLVVGDSQRGLRILRPASYQVLGGRKVVVASSFRGMDGCFGFEVGPYDRRSALIIDPLVLVYSTYLGGRGEEWGYSVAVDASGAAYVAGFTDSLDFPPVTVTKPRKDVFVSKLASDGKSLLYSAFFPSDTDQARLPKLIVDGTGAVYLAGVAVSRQFPVKNAFQKTFKGGWSEAFFLKLAPSGKSLVFSSYLGGSGYDSGIAIAVDAAGSVYVGGQTDSRDFPVKNAFRSALAGRVDVFIAKFTPNGKNLVFATYLGSSGYDTLGGLVVDGQGAVFVTGGAGGTFPLKNPFQKTRGGGYDDAFVSKLAASGDKLVYSSYLGGPQSDRAQGLALDGAGAVYITGYTSGEFPVKNAFQNVRKGSQEGFVTKVAPDGSGTAYSTYLGGSGWENTFDIAVDGKGAAYVFGETRSRDFPLKNPYQSAIKGSKDAFLTVFAPSGKSLVSSTFLGGSYREAWGGIALDSTGGIYVVGSTNSPDFPVLKPYQKALAGSYDAFVLKFKVVD